MFWLPFSNNLSFCISLLLPTEYRKKYISIERNVMENDEIYYPAYFVFLFFAVIYVFIGGTCNTSFFPLYVFPKLSNHYLCDRVTYLPHVFKFQKYLFARNSSWCNDTQNWQYCVLLLFCHFLLCPFQSNFINYFVEYMFNCSLNFLSYPFLVHRICISKPKNMCIILR